MKCSRSRRACAPRRLPRTEREVFSRGDQRGSGASGGFTPSGNGVRAVFITIASMV